VYVVYLVPYVVISYFERYSIPLLGIKVLLVLGAAERLRQLGRSFFAPLFVAGAGAPG
jgi:hypothetical protein